MRRAVIFNLSRLHHEEKHYRAHKKVRVAIVGIGNCASSLVQGIQFYKDTADDATVPGLMHTRLGGYHVGDVEPSICDGTAV